MADASPLPERTVGVLPNGDMLQDVRGNESAEEPQRRRRRRQPPVELPYIEDELKEGTQLQNPTANRKRNDQPKAENADSVQVDNIPQSEVITTVTDGLGRNTPRRVRSQFLDLERGVPINLSGIDQDIVKLSNDDFHSVIGQEDMFGHTDIHSSEPDKIYVERKGKFYALSKRPAGWTASLTDVKSAPIGLQNSASISYIFLIYQIIRRFFLFCHGLLSGIALFHCVIIFTLSPPAQSDWQLFIRFYSPEAMWLKTIYHVLIALCSFSCLCRIDLLGGIDMKLAMKNPESILATILHFSAAALTHICDMTSVRFLMELKENKTDLSTDVIEELTKMKVMDAVRTGFVCAAWLALSFNWRQDRLVSYLKRQFFTK